MIRILLIVFSIMSLGVFAWTFKGEKKVEETAQANDSYDVHFLNIDFCGDTIPLLETRIAKRYHLMLRQYDNPSFRKMRTKAKRQMSVIEPILKRHGIPSDFKYIPIVESAMNSSTSSHRGAKGYWQLMPETARSVGLTVNETIDEREDLVKSTYAASKYLRRLHRQLGSWTLVAAAYNGGPGRIQRRMIEQGKEDYFTLRLNPETTKYVFKLVAAKEWFTNPKRCRQWIEEDIFIKVSEINDWQKKKAEDIIQKELALSTAGS